MSKTLIIALLLVASAIAIAATLTKPAPPASATAPLSSTAAPASPTSATSPKTPASPERPVLYDKSKIEFSVTQMNVPVNGQFRHFKAHVNLDAAKLETSSANVEVDIASITMGDDDADAEAVKKPWLDAAGFPKAVFKSSAVRATGKDSYEVKGVLTLKGKPRELVVPASLSTKPDGTTQVSGKFSLNRTDFGIGGGEWNKEDVVANEIPVKFLIVLGPAH